MIYDRQATNSGVSLILTGSATMISSANIYPPYDVLTSFIVFLVVVCTWLFYEYRD